MPENSRRVVACCLSLVSCLVTLPASSALGGTPITPDAQRVAELAVMLPEVPTGLGRPITDRVAWQPIADASNAEEIIEAAEKLAQTQIPELTDDLYLDFSQTGNRSRCQRVLHLRHTRISRFTLAECLEDRGRFLPVLEESIRAICAEKTWVLPAHDPGLKTFRGEEVNIDLAVAGLSWELATSYYWLGDKLSPEIRQLIRDELRRRTFDPFKSCVNTGTPRMWWVTCTNNWNAVCLAGTVGAALAVIDSPEERAFFIAAAEKSIPYFLSGFTADGYCSEGTGYWNYGFGHYVLLAETLRQATSDQLDWMEVPKVERIATYGRRIEISGGVYPAFADCSTTTRPSSSLMAYLSRRYALGMTEVERRGLGLAGGIPSSLVGLGVYGFPNAASNRSPAEPTPPALRDYFTEAGILIVRPEQHGTCRAGAAIKGGHNAEHHNHNDVGSYVFVVGDRAVLLDPGGEVYTARTFSSRRYESNVLNSYGHPVPRVAGKLQSTGRGAAAKVLRTEFTDAQDTLVLDLTAAYAVKELKSLRRTFVYSREGEGTLAVTDEVEFTSPQTFETALITLGRCKRDGNTLTVYESDEAVRVTLDASAEVDISTEEIEEDVHSRSPPKRIAIRFKQPVIHATVTAKCVPVGLISHESASLLRNGDFSHEDWCWDSYSGSRVEAYLDDLAIVPK